MCFIYKEAPLALDWGSIPHISITGDALVFENVSVSG